MPIDPSVRAVMQRINKKHGEGTVLLGSDIYQPERQTITSGSLSIDAALGGGWATNHWIEVVGHASAGKTLVVLKTIAANQALDPDWTVVWFATEDFVDSYAAMLGVDLDRVIVEDENTMEAVYEHAIEFLDTKAVDCIVIDSLPALVPAREDDDTMEGFQPGLAAFLTGKFFRKSNPSIKRSLIEEERPVTGFVINQWRNKIVRYGDPRTTPGGMAKDFFCFQRVDVRRTDFIKNTRNEPIGQSLKVVNVKNKHSRPGREGVVDAYIASGGGHRAGSYDRVKDIVSAALAYEVIEKSGGNYVFGVDKWYGRPKLDAAVRSDSDLRKRLRSDVLAAAAAPLPVSEEVKSSRRSAKKTVAKKKSAR